MSERCSKCGAGGWSIWDGCKPCNIREEERQLQKELAKNKDEKESEGGGGCYVATAVYGSYDCPEVWVLRRWRDTMLASTRRGRTFIRGYYAISPTVVRLVGKRTWFVRIAKTPLDRLVQRLGLSGLADTPYEDQSRSTK